MNEVTLPNMPAQRAQDFELTEFDPPRFARVIYSREESKADRAVISVQAFEVDVEGRFVASSAINGAPSRTPATTQTIVKTGIGDTHTLRPGFVRVVGSYSDDLEAAIPGQQPLPTGTVTSDQLPESAVEGAQYWVNQTLYRWDAGELARIMRGKAEELSGILRNSDEFAELEL